METRDILLNLRLDRGVSRQKVCDAIGVSLSALTMWEKGERLPKPESYKKLAEYYGVTQAYLRGEDDEPHTLALLPFPYWGKSPLATRCLPAKTYWTMKR